MEKLNFELDREIVKDMIKHYQPDEILWHIQPIENISNLVDFYQQRITNKTKVIVVEYCDSSIFIHQMKMLSKYMYLLGWNIDIILIVEI